MTLGVVIDFLFGRIAAFFLNIESRLMNELQALQTQIADLLAKDDIRSQKENLLNDKVDQLILTASTTKDALVALQGQGTGITGADLQPLIDQLAAAAVKTVAQTAAIDAQTAETVAANDAVAP